MLCEFILLADGTHRCRHCHFVLRTVQPAAQLVKLCTRIRLAETTAAPQAHRQWWDAAHAVATFFSDGLRMVDRETYQARLAVCETCDQRDGNRCGQCGCNLKLKARGRAFDCPLRRWNQPERSKSAAAMHDVNKVVPPRPVLRLRFPHGLGDAVQLTCVLLHLRRLHADWRIHLAVKRGADSLFSGLCDQIERLDQPASPPGSNAMLPDTAYHDLPFDEPEQCHADHPSTKAERCLIESFGIQPIPELCRYQVAVSTTAQQRAAAYLATIAPRDPSSQRFRAVLLHYQGNSARRRKNLDEQIARDACHRARSLGYTPVILDWDGRNRLADGRAVFCPDADDPLWQGLGTGDAETLAALIDQASLMVGIDSGPLHLAGAMQTPTIGVWTLNHPLHYFGLAGHVTHLVPHNHARLLQPEPTVGLHYFQKHYRHRVYHDLRLALPRLMEELLTPPNDLTLADDLWVRAMHHAADLDIVRDVYVQDAYRVAALPRRPRYVLDIGAHLGSFAQRAHQRFARAKIACVEADPGNLPALARNVGGFATIIHAAVCEHNQPARWISTLLTGSTNTGAGRLVRMDETSDDVSSLTSPAPRMTLDAIIERLGWPRVDLIKLDCEGCELEVLARSQGARQAGMLVGEFHDRQQFLDLVRRQHADGQLRILKDDEPGLFWLLRTK